jgi:hypothetical protein
LSPTANRCQPCDRSVGALLISAVSESSNQRGGDEKRSVSPSLVAFCRPIEAHPRLASTQSKAHRRWITHQIPPVDRVNRAQARQADVSLNGPVAATVGSSNK